MCIVAVEDALSEAVVMKLLDGKVSHPTRIIGKKGNGYLKSNLRKFCETARNVGKVLIVTDLDDKPCAPSLVADWFRDITKPPRLLFRVAVRETEAWIMADRTAFADFLGISEDKIQRNIEDILDPKRYLLQLAENSARDLKNELIAQKNTVAVQGLGYNKRLTDFVSNHWCPTRASESSPSLQKAIIRIEAWASDISNKHKVQ